MAVDQLFVRINHVSDRDIVIHRVGCYYIPTLTAGYKMVLKVSKQFKWIGDLWYDHLPRLLNVYPDKKMHFCQRCYPGDRTRDGKIKAAFEYRKEPDWYVRRNCD